MCRRRNLITPRLILGLALVFFGVIFTLDELDAVDADDVVRFWPALLVLAGLAKLFWPGGVGGRFTGVLLILIGSWLLAWEVGYVDYSPWDYWPVVLVLVGLRFLAQGLRGTAGRPVAGRPEGVGTVVDGGTGNGEEAATVSGLAVLGASRMTNRSRNFRGADLAAFMGGCELDLREARIAEPPAVIDAFAMWGGVEIIVPRDWRVTIEGLPLLAGFEDNTRGTDEEPVPGEPRQELVVKGLAIMGGVEVKNRA
jgi:hypothetical protein